MDTQMIQSSPCPLCGENAFSLESWHLDLDVSDYLYLWKMDNPVLDARLQPRECTGCGNVQLVLTRS
jgi:hypothetical protein